MLEKQVIQLNLSKVSTFSSSSAVRNYHTNLNTFGLLTDPFRDPVPERICSTGHYPQLNQTSNTAIVKAI